MDFDVLLKMMSIDTDWKFAASSVDGQSLLIDGIDVWVHRWKDTNEHVVVTDPKYHQEFVFSVFEIRDGEHIVRFAAGEFSNCIWGFYQQQTAATKLFKESAEKGDG